MPVKALAVRGLVGVLGLLIGSTSADCRGADDSAPDFVGFIADVQPGGGEGVQGTILVESHAQKLVRRQEVIVTSDTRLFKEDGGRRIRVGFDALQPKQWVRVWFAGSRMTSDHARAAHEIVIVARP